MLVQVNKSENIAEQLEKMMYSCNHADFKFEDSIEIDENDEIDENSMSEKLNYFTEKFAINEFEKQSVVTNPIKDTLDGENRVLYNSINSTYKPISSDRDFFFTFTI